MTDKIGKLPQKVLAILLCMLTIMSSFALSSGNVYAADGTVSYAKEGVLSYGTHFTHKMYIDGNKKNVAYCTQPSLAAPDDGTHSYTLFSKDSIYRKVLYYLPGGYGYETVTNPRYFKGWSDDDAYVIGHLIVSYIRDNYSMGGDAFLGASQKYIDKTKEVLEIIDEDLPKPPDSFKAFIIKIDGCQDIVGSWYKKPTGWIEINKSSSITGTSKDNPNYSLKGAKYGIYKDGELVETLTTNADGYAKSGELLEGSYTVKEISASPGFALDVTSHSVSVKADKTTETNVKEIPQSNLIDGLLLKKDSETDENVPQGGCGLEDAEFTVKFYAISPTASVSGKTPARTWVLKTDDKGEVRFDSAHFVSGDSFYYNSAGKPTLPIGKVTITETKAPTGYLLNTLTYESEITEKGTAENLTVYNTTIVKEQVKRGDLEFVKVADGSLNRLANVPFKLTSLTTGESHIIMTDGNGYASTASSWNKHSYNTNAGSSPEDGIWFGTSPANDSKGALIYDDYELEELACEANEGMHLIKIKVSVYKDNVTIPLGTLTDDPIEIETTAKDSESGTHYGVPEGTVTIVDTVSYKGLTAGKSYLLVGTLMNKDTGEYIKDADGNPITSTKTFTAKKTSGSVKITFKVDSSLLKGKATVVFEDLFFEDIRVATHADIEDDDQTVYYPVIGTTAKDKADGDKVIANDSTATVVDTVKYEGLMPGETYTVKGFLINKSKGKAVTDAKGNKITSEKEFTAEAANGTVDVEFTFSTKDLDGESLVVFEELYEADGQLIAWHKDLTDKGQTVTVNKPEVPEKTTPKKPEKSTPTDTPKTGDDSAPLLWALLAIAALAGLITLKIATAIRKERAAELEDNEEIDVETSDEE